MTTSASRPEVTGRRPATSRERTRAVDRPIARVLVDVPLAHLDRPFDYLVDEADSATAQPGVRVKVRFAGRAVPGFVVERRAESEHGGRLAWLERVVSPEPVLTAEIAALARAVADRYAGSIGDVLRLAIPPRHARVEAEPVSDPPVAPESDTTPAVGGWADYQAGPAFLTALRDRRPARAVWQALPGADWTARVVEAAAAVPPDSGVLLIVPDARDLRRLDEALTAGLGGRPHVTLSAELGPAERYRRFLAVRRGQVRVVAGTRAAVFAPVADLALVAVLDDGDDLLAEPRAPYPHAREVLMLRSAARPCALLVGGFARTAEAQLLVESGWAHPITAARERVRVAAPRIEAAADGWGPGADSGAAHARLSPTAFAAARSALTAGAPVLVQVPRRGYRPALACGRCRRPSSCRRCAGPLGQPDRGGPPTCRWCGVPDAHVVCAACGSPELRAVTVGSGRTAEEFGRAFPAVPVITSAAPHVRDRVDGRPAVVIATPGAEPVADGGYGAALLLDGWALLGRPDLRAGEETLRRWMAAAALVRPVGEGGRVVVGADVGTPTVQALIRWDAVGAAAAELAARRELGFPPVSAMVSLDATEPVMATLLDGWEPPDGVEVLGPVDLEPPPPSRTAGASGAPTGPLEPRVRTLLRAGPRDRRTMLAAVRALVVARSARKDAGSVRVQVDPTALF
ncbi:primosomal protein N' [Nakamurella flava]|uniref:primosomal protein N' n=1 Tax=Nakamurella flava TaxID=2576308 RepID=UPI00197C8E55|nr:primosomal protein N' [Nakamurella flava]